MSSEDFTKSLFQYIDEHQKDYVQRLSEAVSIPSVSAWPEHRPEVVRMVQWTKSQMEALGIQVELADIGEQKLADGSKIKLPDVILGTFRCSAGQFIRWLGYGTIYFNRKKR